MISLKFGEHSKEMNVDVFLSVAWREMAVQKMGKVPDQCTDFASIK